MKRGREEMECGKVVKGAFVCGLLLLFEAMVLFMKMRRKERRPKGVYKPLAKKPTKRR